MCTTNKDVGFRLRLGCVAFILLQGVWKVYSGLLRGVAEELKDSVSPTNTHQHPYTAGFPVFLSRGLAGLSKRNLLQYTSGQQKQSVENLLVFLASNLKHNK